MGFNLDFPKTRAEARARGFTYYFTGEPCHRGHIACRMTSSPSCEDCREIQKRSEAFLATQKRYRERPENKYAQKGRRLRHQYGMGLPEYEALLKKQNSKCAICDCPLTDGRGSRSAHVDHCHKTGTVRGILCNGCNHGIGAMRENEDALAQAIVYLRRARNGF